MNRLVRTIAVIGVGAGLACADSVGTAPARLSIRLTDAPADYIESATVEIGEVTAIVEGGPPVTVTSDGGTHNLMDLQNGVTVTLGSVDVDPGRYLEVRLVVLSATVTLKSGFLFDDGTDTASPAVPSGAQSGIKIKLDDADGDPTTNGVQITSGETVLVVDFDVARNFKIQGNPNTPAGIKGVLFTPVLRATVSDVAASISGTVTSTSSASVEGLTVSATVPGDTAATATTTTNAAGEYSLLFLPPGTYDVVVDESTASPASQSVTVADAENATGVDFTIS